jgi:hypothetical protein
LCRLRWRVDYQKGELNALTLSYFEDTLNFCETAQKV